MKPLRILHVEWLKTRRRPVFWVGLILYFGLVAFGSYMTYRRHLQNPARGGLNLPRNWDDATALIGGIGGTVVTVIVILLTASEKTWRTERQNVIDGLSRNQYFLGKLFVLIGVSVVVWAGAIGILSLFGALDRTITPSTLPLIDALAGRLLGGVLVQLLLVAAVAFCFALVSSGSGAALAFAVLFLIVQQPLMAVMMDNGGAWVEVARHMPARIMSNLMEANIYDAAQLVQTNERLRSIAERTGLPPHALQLMGPARALGIATIYITLFTAAGWLSIRRRDL